MEGSIDTSSQKEEEKVKVEAPSRRKKLGGSVTASKYDLNYGIPSKKATHTFVAQENGLDSWQVKIHDFIEQQWVQYVLVGLLMSDILIIFAELFLQSEYPSCRLVTRDCKACCPSDSYVGEDSPGRWLAESLCDAGYAETGTAACDKHKYAGVHLAEEVLFSITIVILS